MGMPRVIDLGRLDYARAYQEQVRHVDEVLAARTRGELDAGRVLVVEHDPVITVSRRPGASRHVIATADSLARAGVAIAETDRGGDVTYHGPGQLVVYPILDLSALNLGLHAYMRLLEDSVIDALAALGMRGLRDPAATGVWVDTSDGGRGDTPVAKVCAMGVRVRKWVSMHGLALNVSPNLDHFALIVPCGLVGRPVTSLEVLAHARGETPPTMGQAAQDVTGALTRRVREAREAAARARAAHATHHGAFPSD
ncbi:MAG: lipoyl(octanoyl) transferase LipB [Phycisphaerae bacterium]|nr:lipoyl(octanoyl) transferase LipB [Phycisphaerae bacterium]